MHTIPLDLSCCTSPLSSSCVKGMPSAQSGSAIIYMNGLPCTSLPTILPIASKFGLRAIFTSLASAFLAGCIAAFATFVVERLGGVKGGILASTPTTIIPALIGMRSNSASPEDFASSVWLLPVGAVCNSFFLAAWRFGPSRLPHHWTLRLKCVNASSAPAALAGMVSDSWCRLLAIIVTSLSFWLFAVLLVKGWLGVACFDQLYTHHLLPCSPNVPSAHF